MSVENRKIGYYSIEFKLYRKGKNFDNTFDAKYFLDILNFIQSDTVNRIIKLDKEKKSYFLDSCEYNAEHDCYNIVFKSCKYGHFPPYMNSETGIERDTSKTQDEGETEKTHLCIKIDHSEALVFLEERKSGVGISKIVKYFNNMVDQYCHINKEKREYTLVALQIPSDNFLSALNRTTGIKEMSIYTAKKVLGDEALNYVDEEDPYIKNEITINIKAIPKQSLLKRTVKGLYNSMISTDSEVSRIRIRCNEGSGNKILDSQFCRETKILEARLDIDGTVNSESIFKQMMNLIEG